MLDYFDVLADLHRSLRPATYLEVGVFRGDSLRLASSDTLSVGVDPEPILAPGNESNRHVEVMTSDAFFAGPRPHELFGDRPVDLVFIDGMHLFEYVLRDFMNAEALASPESLIALHDCLPRDASTASRERATEHWTGDVWKLILCLLDQRPDLELSIIDVPHSGLCLVRGLNPSDHTLRDNYDTILEKYQTLGFEEWEARVAEVLQRTRRQPEAELWSLRMSVATLQDRLTETQALAAAEAADLRARLADSESESAGLRARLADSESLVAAVEEQMRTVTASTSWRLTAPLRRAGTLVRRGRACPLVAAPSPRVTHSAPSPQSILSRTAYDQDLHT